MECGLVVAVDADTIEIAVPGLARILAQFLLPLAEQKSVPGALHVPGREGLAVVPFHARMQFEGELRLVGVPRPAVGQVGHDRGEAVLRYMLIVEDQVVVDRHEGNDRGVGRLLEDRAARRIVAVIHLQNAAALLCAHIAAHRQSGAHGDDRHHQSKNWPHGLPPDESWSNATLPRILGTSIGRRQRRCRLTGPDSSVRSRHATAARDFSSRMSMTLSS